MLYVDCATVLTEPVIQGLVKAEVAGVCRYMVPDNYSKYLRQSEVELLKRYGVKIVSVWETYANRINEGTEAGEEDASHAVVLADQLGMPSTAAVYYTCDFDADYRNYDAIEQYLLKAREIQDGRWKTGLYAEFDIIEEMYERGAADCYWQTYAWSGGKVSKHANLYQFKNNQVMAGITVDYNYCYGNEGSWGGEQVAEKKTRFSDVPAEHWAEDSILVADEAGIMTGYEDGTFRPDQTVTRAEMAKIVNELLWRINQNNN